MEYKHPVSCQVILLFNEIFNLTSSFLCLKIRSIKNGSLHIKHMLIISGQAVIDADGFVDVTYFFKNS